jgi:D-3-phosphoglycerate dehydrogenase
MGVKGKIAVTPRSLSREGHPALEKLRQAGFEVVFPTPGRQPEESEIAAFLPECVGYLAGVEPVSREVLARSPQLKVISRNGVGVDNIDLQAAEELGIRVEIAHGANAQGVAELALALILAGVRDVPWSDRMLKAGEWQRKQGIELAGRMLGVVGCGQIGKRLVEMAVGVGMRVRAFDLFPDVSFKPSGDFAFTALDDLLAEADVISLHCPAGDQPLIDAAAIARMKNGVFLVNTARAALVDDDAVLAALNSGKLSGFATDVYHQEPPGASELLRHELVIATPHAGGFTEESVRRASEAAVDNLLDVLV